MACTWESQLQLKLCQERSVPKLMWIGWVKVIGNFCTSSIIIVELGLNGAKTKTVRHSWLKLGGQVKRR